MPTWGEVSSALGGDEPAPNAPIQVERADIEWIFALAAQHINHRNIEVFDNEASLMRLNEIKNKMGLS